MVKNLVGILAAGLVLFLSLALAQEWSFFAEAWFGAEESVGASAPEDLRAAEETVRTLLALTGHLYSSGGDRRFAERLPASEEVVAEIMTDIDYLRRNHRRQESSLLNLQVTKSEELAVGRIEVQTREYWIHRSFWTSRPGASDPALPSVVSSKYLVVRQGERWRVEAWGHSRVEPDPTTDSPT